MAISLRTIKQEGQGVPNKIIWCDTNDDYKLLAAVILNGYGASHQQPELRQLIAQLRMDTEQAAPARPRGPNICPSCDKSDALTGTLVVETGMYRVSCRFCRFTKEVDPATKRCIVCGAMATPGFQTCNCCRGELKQRHNL